MKPLKTYRHELWVCLLLAVAVWGVFGQTVRFGFVNFDDPDYVYQSPVVLQGLTLEGVRYAFTSRLANGWYPLTTMSLMLDATFYGNQPGGYHGTNVLLHTFAVFALFLALRALTGSVWRSAFVAAVFAIHPLRAESVAWISERKDVLSGLFFFLTLGAYARYARCGIRDARCGIRDAGYGMRDASGKEQGAGVRGQKPLATRHSPLATPAYWLVVLFFACGLMSKPTVVTLPFVLLLLDFWPLRRFGGPKTEDRRQTTVVRTPSTNNHQRTTSPANNYQLILEKLPLFALSVAAAAGTMVAEQAALNQGQLSFLTRVGNAFRSYAVYILQTFRPADLSVFYRHLWKDLPLWQVAGGLVLVLAVSAAVLLARRRQPALLTGWLWYLGTLVPVLGIIQAGAQAHADRYTYLPQTGLILMVVWGVADAASGRRNLRRMLPVAAVCTLAVLAAAAYVQTGVWRNSDRLWRHALECDPYNYQACDSLANSLLEAGRYAEAEIYFDRAIRIWPTYTDALYNRGNLAAGLGRLEEAVSYYDRVLQTKPDYYKAHQNKGTTLLRMGQPEKAAACYERGLQLRPGDAKLTELLQQARAQRQAAQLSREAAQAQAQGDSAGAAALYRRALRLTPDFIPVLNNLAWLLATVSDTALRNGAEAVTLAERAARLTGGGSPALLDTLSAAYAEAGRFDEAIKTAELAEKLARDGGNDAQADKIGARLELYRQKMPFRP